MNVKMKGSQVLTNLDADGNITDEQNVKVLYGKSRTYFKKGNFFLMSKAFTKFMITRRSKYNNITVFLLFALLDGIDFNNRIETFRQTELAEKLETSQANISRALKTLIEDKVIEKKGNDYYFCEEFAKFAFDERGKK